MDNTNDFLVVLQLNIMNEKNGFCKSVKNSLAKRIFCFIVIKVEKIEKTEVFSRKY